MTKQKPRPLSATMSLVLVGVALNDENTIFAAKTGTWAALVTRGLVTPGSRPTDHQLTDAGRAEAARLGALSDRLNANHTINWQCDQHGVWVSTRANDYRACCPLATELGAYSATERVRCAHCEEPIRDPRFGKFDGREFGATSADGAVCRWCSLHDHSTDSDCTSTCPSWTEPIVIPAAPAPRAWFNDESGEIIPAESLDAVIAMNGLRMIERADGRITLLNDATGHDWGTYELRDDPTEKITIPAVTDAQRDDSLRAAHATIAQVKAEFSAQVLWTAAALEVEIHKLMAALGHLTIAEDRESA